MIILGAYPKQQYFRIGSLRKPVPLGYEPEGQSAAHIALEWLVRLTAWID